MEFTEEQQAHIDKLLEEQSKHLYTKEDLDRKVTAEVDRRVESGIQKGLETHKSKWQEEFEKKASMTAEELAHEKLQKQLEDLEERENEIFKKTNELNAKDKLTEANIPKEHYEKFINILVTEDDESTTENVNNFIETFNDTKSTLESDIKKKYADVPPPSQGSNKSDTITKEDFENMGYTERLKLKNEDEELYNKLSK